MGPTRGGFMVRLQLLTFALALSPAFAVAQDGDRKEAPPPDKVDDVMRQLHRLHELMERLHEKLPELRKGDTDESHKARWEALLKKLAELREWLRDHKEDLKDKREDVR